MACAKGNKTADEIYTTARRAALRLKNDYGMPLDHIFIDMSVLGHHRRHRRASTAAPWTRSGSSAPIRTSRAST